MMESLRNAAKGWMAKVLIGLLAVSFAVWGIADVFRGGTANTLASVGEQEIPAARFDSAFKDYLQALSRQAGKGMTPEEARAMGIDKAVLDSLIQQAALDDQASKLKLGVSNTYLAQDLMKDPAFHNSQGVFDAERFKQLLAQNNLTEEMFFGEERQRLLREALGNTASGGIPVSLGLIEAQYRHDSEQRDARFFLITAADSEVPAPTEDEIRKEYEANPSAYTAPEYRAVAVMKVEPADIAAAMALTDQDLADAFEKYKADYFTPETRTILQLSFPTEADAVAAKQKLSGGTDFLALATERGFTEADITFADKTKAEFIDPAIAEAAFALTEGAVSDPVKGQFSTVLLKAVKVTPEKQSTLVEVKPALQERVRLERAAEEIQSIYDAVEDARAAQTSFEDIAAKAGIPFQLVAATDAQGKDKDGKDVAMPHAKEVLQAAFTSDVGVENDAISLDNGYVWYEVREVVPAAVRPLDAVRDQAAKAVTAQKLEAHVGEKAKALVERARGGATLDALASEAKATVATAQGIRRSEASEGFGPAAVAALFAVPDKGFAYALEPDGRSARVMQSEPVLLPAFDPASPEAKAIADRLKPQLSDTMLQAYLAAVQDEAGVKINETLWRNVTGQQTN